MNVEALALEALTRGSVDVVTRSSFAPGEAKALAIDAHDGTAAVLVVRRRRDDAWIVDVVRFVNEAGTWTDLGSGGGTWGELPLDRDPSERPSLGPISFGWSLVRDEGLVTAGGFVSGAVHSVEIVVGDQTRRVALRPDSAAFVIAAKAADDHDVDAIDVRALDRNGDVVDSSAARRAERDAALPGITVAQALELPNGSRATVRGVLLALPGQAPLLCDDIDAGPPPECSGAALRLNTSDPMPPTAVEDGSFSTFMMVVSGVIQDGLLTPVE
ncbi:MAG: hypothetical protein AB1673_11880 [Actinomycetota bacterium]